MEDQLSLEKRGTGISLKVIRSPENPGHILYFEMFICYFENDRKKEQK